MNNAVELGLLDGGSCHESEAALFSQHSCTLLATGLFSEPPLELPEVSVQWLEMGAEPVLTTQHSLELSSHL